MYIISFFLILLPRYTCLKATKIAARPSGKDQVRARKKCPSARIKLKVLNEKNIPIQNDNKRLTPSKRAKTYTATAMGAAFNIENICMICEGSLIPVRSIKTFIPSISNVFPTGYEEKFN